jgi:hypothetical protein
VKNGPIHLRASCTASADENDRKLELKKVK